LLSDLYDLRRAAAPRQPELNLTVTTNQQKNPFPTEPFSARSYTHDEAVDLSRQKTAAGRDT
jgi:hypothetical protein